jgi:alkylation response protein AidB-like acyl-CoA dehydrogenase
MKGRASMDELEADDAELDERVEDWLRVNLPVAWVDAIDRDDAAALRQAREQLDVADWWARLGAAGWFFSTWPTEYGGLGFDSHRAGVVNNALRRFKVPRTDNPLGINVSQALLRWGTDAQRRRFLPPIATQREIWVQLFSEPGAGSDLAGLSTRAVRDGDQWIVNGQKVWSSWAHKAHHGFLLARTDPDVPKHQGLSVFLLDMSTPGITIRPLRQMTGEAFFNEVFFDGVVCPDEMRMGELGQGWRMASSLLTYERGAGVGGGSAAPSMHVGRSVDALIRHYGPVHQPMLRERLVVAYTRDKIAHWTRMRIEAQRHAGRPPGQESSILKLFASDSSQALQTLSLDLEGLNGVAHGDDDRWAETSQYGFLRVRSATIAGGTSEIQRNILGEKVLGLPKEPAADRNIPWSQVLRSS